jgi:transcriptional regulator with XRE-family HTH domain
VAGTGKGSNARQRELGRRIRARRTAMGLSQEQLGHRAGLHRTYIASLESGERNPGLHTLVKLALGLGIDVADLVRGLQGFDARA